MRHTHSFIWRKEIEPFRVRTGMFGSDPCDERNGVFLISPFRIVCSDGMGWEHVSVSLPDRTPTWDDMCRVKDLFWGEEEEVVQFHPKKSEYVNCHPHCLHLWRPTESVIPRPPSIMVGPKTTMAEPV